MLEDFICFVMKLVLICIGLYVIIFIFTACLLLPSMFWDFSKDLTAEDKAEYAQMASLPEIADSIERYGTKGFFEKSRRIETVSFRSLDELCAIMSADMQKIIRSTVERETDVNGKIPSTCRISEDDFPAEIKEANDDYGRSYLIHTKESGECYLEIFFP